MHTLYQTPSSITRGRVVIGSWRVVQNQLIEQVEKIVGYYRHSSRVIENSHLLNRLIRSFSVRVDQPADIYHDKVLDQTWTVASGVGLTTMLQKGRVHSAFYDGSMELVIGGIDDYDHKQMESNWRNMRPIRVLSHDFDDLTLPLPDGRQSSPSNAVVYINIPMLMSQYRMWELHENRRLETPLFPQHFLSKYAIPNMLYSHTDIALLNRVGTLIQGNTPTSSTRVHPFWTLDLDKRINDALRPWVRSFTQRTDWSVDDLLLNVPTVFTTDIRKSLRNPEGGYARQMQTALIVAKLRTTGWLLKTLKETGNRESMTWQLDLVKKLRYMDQSNQIDWGLSKPYSQHVRSYIDTHIRPYLP